MEFEHFWRVLQSDWPVTEIENWTVAKKGHVGENFTIIDVERDRVVVRPPSAQNHQRVPKGDFEKMYRLWPAYKSSQTKREELRSVTRFSKYIISIFHWFEETHQTIP